MHPVTQIGYVMVVQSIELIDGLMKNYWTIALLARSSKGKRSKVLSMLVGKSNYSNDSFQQGFPIGFSVNSLLGDREAFPF